MLKNMKIRSSLLLGFGITILISIIIISATLILMNTQRATYSRIINSEIEACTVIKNSRLHANIAARNLRNILLIPTNPDNVSMQTVIQESLGELEQDLTVVLARAICKNISRAEVHQLVDALFDSYGNLDCKKKSGEQ